METKPNFIVPLSDPSAGLSQVGGKGASLARLAAAGLPVPPGFHITTAAYRRFVTEHGLQEQILAAVSAATPDQPATLEEASSRIGQLFAQCAMPDEIAEAIRRAYAGLGEGDVPVAVRSSATAEETISVRLYADRSPNPTSVSFSSARFYNALIKRKEDPAATAFLLGLESLPLRAEKSLFDLAQWAQGAARAGGSPGANACGGSLG